MKKILFYTNQFFGQIGGEEKAYEKPVIKKGPVGPAVALSGRLENAEIAATIICGDNYYIENMDLVKAFIKEQLDHYEIDLFISGPAFNASRFAIACADAGAYVKKTFGIEAVTALYPENPAVEMYNRDLYILATGNSAANMKKAIEDIIRFSNKLLSGPPLGSPKEEGIFQSVPAKYDPVNANKDPNCISLMENMDIVTVEVNASLVPSIIQGQFTGLKALKDNVSEATKKAESAKKSAQTAKEKSTGIFQNKGAIESLQEATVDLAEAQISAVQAQEVSFEYQQKIAEITKYLFALGVSNISMNRSVIRELELKLKGASEEELDEFARQELIAVVKQLKAQEDIMKKQSDLSDKVKAHETTLRTHEQKDSEFERRFKELEDHEKRQDSLFKEHAEKNKEHDKLITGNKQKTIEHDKILAEKTKKDKNQDEEIARQAANDEKLLKLVNQLLESNIEKETQIRELQAVCEKLTKSISENAILFENKESGIVKRLSEKASKKSVIISYLVGAAGVTTAVIQFFI